MPRGSAAASPERTVSLCSATQPVRPSPIATRRVSGSGSLLPRNVPWKAIGSQIPAAWSTR